MVARNAKRIMMTLGDSKFTKVVFQRFEPVYFTLECFWEVTRGMHPLFM